MSISFWNPPYPDIVYRYKSISQDLYHYLDEIIVANKATGFSKVLQSNANTTDVNLQIYKEYIRKGLVDLVVKDIKNQWVWWFVDEFDTQQTPENHQGNPGRMLVELIGILHDQGRRDKIHEILTIVIKKQISQITYTCRGSRTFNCNVDPVIENALVSLDAGFEYSKKVLTDPSDKETLSILESMVSKARRSAQSVLKMEKPPITQPDANGSYKSHLKKLYETKAKTGRVSDA